MLRALYEKHVLPSFKKARKVGKELPDLLTLFFTYFKCLFHTQSCQEVLCQLKGLRIESHR